jgi:hypothetical protein
MISHGLSKRVIPKLYKDKQNQKGLVDLFLEKIPNGLGKRIYERLDSDKLKECKEIIQFLDLFYKELQRLKFRSEENSVLFKVITPVLPKPSPTLASMVDNTGRAALESAEFADFYPGDPDSEFYEEPWNASKSPYNIPPDIFSGSSSLPDNQHIDEGCFHQILYGKCDSRDTCPYRHDEEACRESWKTYFDKLAKSPYNADDDSRNLPPAQNIAPENFDPDPGNIQRKLDLNYLNKPKAPFASTGLVKKIHSGQIPGSRRF